MDILVHLQQMADYNQWSNANLIDACSNLSINQLTENQGAYFHSILGTLNHIFVGDLIWLNRFSQCPALPTESLRIINGVAHFPSPAHLDQTLYDDFSIYRKKRVELDALIVDWVNSLDSVVLNYPLTYRNSKNIEATRPLGLLLSHFFNHQTHHRGQAGTLLCQLGVDPGVTDLLVRIPVVEAISL